MKVNRGSGAGSPEGLRPQQQALTASPARAAGLARLPSAQPAETHFTQARPAANSSSIPGTSAPVPRLDSAPGLARPARLEARSLELASRLAGAPADIKGAELARLQGPAILARVQRALLPLADRLATAQASRTDPLASLAPPVTLGAAARSGLRTAATLASEALRLEDLGPQRLSVPGVERDLFRLDLALLGRDVEGFRGLDGIRTASQQALAALLLH